eukprot:CAMPEP_0196816086 /NCGR_PEP_ID=MMETSP1362-20130617/53489_1 /TAXON_ID=163516 /ORGANISM="Leptocylindrus danicus, Strain CCMP1856" /LENGTH=235 /DNA_ID=CAMNT_0042193299 /DNA_START=189 /DNA_END=893 /DNA_ORIENTATION=-
MSADDESNINDDNDPPPDPATAPSPNSFFLYGTTILSALALTFSVASTMSCTFTKRSFSTRVVGNVHAKDLDLFLGIWTWRGLALTNDADTCFRYDELIGSGNDEDDVMMTVVRTVSVLAGLCSGSTMCLAVLLHVSSAARQNDNDLALCHRHCRRCTYDNVLTLSVLSFLASVLEGLKVLLMIFLAEICSDDRFFEGVGGSVATYDSCRASSGAYICVLSAASSFLAGAMILLW